MWIYILQLVLICLYALIFLAPKRKHKKIFMVLTFLTLVVVAALRKYTVGYDNTQYMIAYTKASDIENVNDFANLRYEYGFTFLLYILNKITDNYQILFILTSIFINYSVMRFIYKKSNNPLVSVLLYVLLNFYFFYTSAMRQAIAIAIILLGLDHIEKKEFKKFIPYLIFACLFHMSSLLALLFIPLRKNNYSKKFIYFMIAGYIIAFIFGREIYSVLMNFSDKLYSYGYSKFAETNYFGALFKFFVSFLFFILPLQWLRRHNDSVFQNKEDKLNFYVGILAVANLFALLTMKVGIFDRFLPFFTIFTIAWLPNVVSLMNSPKRRFVVYSVSMAIAFAYWLIICLFRPEWLSMIPYKFFWQ